MIREDIDLDFIQHIKHDDKERVLVDDATSNVDVGILLNEHLTKSLDYWSTKVRFPFRLAQPFICQQWGNFFVAHKVLGSSAALVIFNFLRLFLSLVLVGNYQAFVYPLLMLIDVTMGSCDATV